MFSGQHVQQEAAEMEPEDEIYVNLEDLRATLGRTEEPTTSRSKAVQSDSVAEEETETWSAVKAAAVFLGLLCFVLLTSMIGVAVTYDRDFTRLSGDLANHTAERNQLRSRTQNLSDERDRLEIRLSEAEFDLITLRKDSATCPYGWSRFGCSCYQLSTTMNIWSSSKRLCENQGATLVIISSREEMVFLNTLGARLKFWIGLSQPQSSSTWTWTDGRSAEVTYWQSGYAPWYTGSRTKGCAAFNSFHTGTFNVQSWSSELCATYLQWVCEKEATPSSSGTINW